MEKVDKDYDGQLTGDLPDAAPALPALADAVGGAGGVEVPGGHPVGQGLQAGSVHLGVVANSPKMEVTFY